MGVGDGVTVEAPTGVKADVAVAAVVCGLVDVEGLAGLLLGEDNVDVSVITLVRLTVDVVSLALGVVALTPPAVSVELGDEIGPYPGGMVYTVA